MEQESIRSSLASYRNRFNGTKNTEDLLASVREVVPLSPECYKVNNVEGSPTRYLATIDIQIESAATFIDAYTSRTSETLRPMSIQQLGKKNIHDCVFPYRCQHRTYHQPTMNAAEHIRRKPSKRL